MKVPRLHVIVTDRVAADPAFDGRADGLLAALGSDLALHLRLRESTDRELHRRAAQLAETARHHGGWLVVNGRLDVALAVGAHAVQLGAGALPLHAARRVAGETMVLGASVHSTDEARRAAGSGANYLLLGTIYETPSHPGRSGAGPALVEACADLEVPIVAIGGITRERVGDVRRAGARGVAVIRAVLEARDPVRAARGLLEELIRTEAGTSDRGRE